MYNGVDKSELEEFDTEYQEAPVKERSFDPIPDGRYLVTVDKIEITRAKQSGNPMLKWHLRILTAGKYRDRLLWRNNLLVTPQNMQWLKSDLHICGVDLVKLSELPDRLSDLLDIELDVSVQNRDDFCNVYINKRLRTDGVDAPADDPEIKSKSKTGRKSTKTISKEDESDEPIPF